MANWKGVQYSDNDVLTMQQEAIRRVRQMQQRSAQQVASDTPPPTYDVPTLEPEPNLHTTVSTGTAPMRQQQMSPPGSPQNGPSSNQQGHNGLLSQLGLGQIGSNLGQIGSNLGISNIMDKLKGLGSGSSHEEGAPKEKGIGNIISSIVGEDTAIGKVFAALNIDNERLILIGLLLILMNEKADLTLLVALFYLLL